MSDVDRFTRQGVGSSDRPGFWVHAGDFNQKMAQARDREAYLEGEIEKWTALSGNNFKRAEILKLERDALQQRLTEADQRIDELTAKPSDVERQRLMEIVERYPNGDPLEYSAAVRKLQQ
ncbi:hypothetical protein [Pseudomonas sp. BF-RE-29]|uniref:hypothetical protein n=1 Tax=Pseudomonas sp. BF-RE-29 TaxID=2832378 RepID=UPI001CC05C6E|nr:hypothetical protein [Pseudomonas sp. BF-RE-29]